MIFSYLRRSTICVGTMEQRVKITGCEIIQSQVSSGMVVSRSFTAGEDETLYVRLRCFAGKAERERLYAKVYGSGRWKKAIAHKIDPLLDRSTIAVTRRLPWPSPSSSRVREPRCQVRVNDHED